MKVVLFSSIPEGHQLILHVRAIAHEMLRRGWTPHLVLPASACSHPTYKTLQEEFGDRLPTTVMPEVKTKKIESGPMRELRRIMQPDFATREAFQAGLEAVLKVIQPDALYFINLDNFDRSVSLKGFQSHGIPMAGMLMGRHFHYAPMGIPVPMGKVEKFLSPFLFRRLLRRSEVTKITIIDPLLEEYAQKVKLPGRDKLVFIPDIGKLKPFSREDSIREEFGFASDEFVLLSFGWLHPRKGIAEIMGAMDHPDWPSGARVLMVGSARPEAKELLESELGKKLIASGRLVVKEGFADDNLEGRSFAGSDAIWLGYRGHWTMSGVLVQACLALRPVVSMNQGLIGWYTRRYGIGVEVDIDSSASICAGIEKLKSDAALYAECQKNAASIAELHSPGSFERKVCDCIAGMVGPTRA